MTPILAVLALLAEPAVAQPPKGPIKVFVLAGQSNMEGKAKISVIEAQLQIPEKRARFEHLKKDGKWIERDDVYVKYLKEKGKLTVGYGNPKSIGPELGFGLSLGDRYDEPVLLVKTAWGGRSLVRDFRSPSAGLPPKATLDKALANLQKKKADATLDDVTKPYGATYREMLAEVRDTLKNVGTHFPTLAGRDVELAGFVWFQGWNDMIDAEATAAYAENLAHFIRDVRKDLSAPKLPFVVGQMGVDGEKATGGVLKFKNAQADVMKVAEFAGNVALVKTDVHWDMEADAVFRKGWRENLALWNQVGSDFPYHYLGSPVTHLGIGRAFADAALKLRDETK